MAIDRLILADEIGDPLDAGFHAEAHVREPGLGHMTNEVLAAVMQNVVGAGLDRKLDLLMQSALDDHVAQLVDTSGLVAEIVVAGHEGFLSLLLGPDSTRPADCRPPPV